MEELHSLLHSLSRAQIRLLRNYLTCFSSRGESDAKTLHLTELLLAGEEVPSIRVCSNAIYQCEPDSKILKLKSRLKSKILDSLLLDINIDRPDSLDELDLSVIKIKKRLALCYTLLYSVGYNSITRSLIQEVISLAKTYENYSTLIEALRLINWRENSRKNEKNFINLSEDIAQYEKRLAYINKAIDLYYLFVLKNNSTANPNQKKLQSFLQESIFELKSYYDETSSALIGYYLKVLENAYFQNSKNYISARDVCIEQLAIVNNNKSVYRKQRVGIAYDNIAQCDIYIGDYAKAARNAQAAQKHFLKNSTNYTVAKEIEFCATLYNREYQKARSISTSLISSIKNGNSGMILAKYRFFKANAYFMTADYKECLKLVTEKQEISKDKGGWEVAIRILTILCHIELGYFDIASQQIDGLRRYIDRQGKVTDIRERDKLIARALQLMSKRGFSYDQIGEKELDVLRQLAGDDKKYKWEVLTSELIPFHQWATNKYHIDLSPSASAKIHKTPKRKQVIG